MTSFSADWILPISSAPIRDGVITVDRGTIVAVGDRRTEDTVSLGRVAVLPALVNAHTHLELSFLHGRIPPSDSFNDWVMTMMATRRASMTSPTAEPILEAARRAIDQARASGTGLMGDVSNTLATVRTLRESQMPAHVFHELIGFNTGDASIRLQQGRSGIDAAGADEAGVRISLAPHAPYSVSPALFAAIRADVDAHPYPVTGVHLGESTAEVELLRHGTGAARDMLETLGVWSDAWEVPGVSPVAYLDRVGFLDARTLVVHGVQFTSVDLERVRTVGATLVSCPRSNVYVGVGSPPIQSFFDAGVSVAFGTDSLASVADLNMFSEMAEARRVAPEVPARRLLQSATLTGAAALGFARELGSIEPGKRAALIAVQLPADVIDVEEYLVGGVEPAAIAWLDSSSPAVHA